MTLVRSAFLSAAVIAALLGVAMLAIIVWVRVEMRSGLVSRAVDQGACSAARHEYLFDTREMTRERITGASDCFRQMYRMLASSRYFQCSTAAGFQTCHRFLNSDPDDRSDTTLAIRGATATLENIPT